MWGPPKLLPCATWSLSTIYLMFLFWLIFSALFVKNLYPTMAYDLNKFQPSALFKSFWKELHTFSNIFHSSIFLYPFPNFC